MRRRKGGRGAKGSGRVRKVVMVDWKAKLEYSVGVGSCMWIDLR